MPGPGENDPCLHSLLAADHKIVGRNDAAITRIQREDVSWSHSFVKEFGSLDASPLPNQLLTNLP